MHILLIRPLVAPEAGVLHLEPRQTVNSTSIPPLAAISGNRYFK